jgi:hypothetical protein
MDQRPKEQKPELSILALEESRFLGRVIRRELFDVLGILRDPVWGPVTVTELREHPVLRDDISALCVEILGIFQEAGITIPTRSRAKAALRVIEYSEEQRKHRLPD